MLTRISPFVLLVALAAAQDPAAPPASPEARSELPAPPKAMGTIDRKELLAHATWLAADERGGRLTGSPGQIAAANYIAEHFAKLGLEPLGDEVEGKRGWLQHYGITRTFVAAGSELRFGNTKLTEGFAVLGGKPQQTSIEGPLRFCGTGRFAGERADVPADESLAGKVAVVLIKNPRGKVDQSLGIEAKMGMSFSTMQQFGAKTKALEKRDAAAVLFVQLEDPIGLADTLNYVALAPGKDSLVARFRGGDGSMAMMGAMLGGNAKLPAFVLSVPSGKQLLGELGLDPAELQKLLDAEDGTPAFPAGKTDVAAKIQIEVGRDAEATACNVVAVLRGSDPELSKEAIVYSAHMDHVGTRIDGEIFNGADDNASGSAGLLAIASAYAKSEEKPKRSVIFLSVSGEELGLWGSAYFADHPTWPADQLIANVNTDMIGRSGPESGPMEITVTPSNRHRMFSTIVQDAARFGEALGCTFTSGDKYYERSDHYNFAKKGIPVVFFCNGEHPDYHQVTDHADKLDGEKMERIARLAFWTGWSVANAAERPRKLGKRETWY